jgi:SAM-dependent methyltransferase
MALDSRTHKRRIDRWLAARGAASVLSLPAYLVARRVTEILALLPAGRLLDAGSGLAPFREDLIDRCFEVQTLEIEDRGRGVDIVADLQAMPEVPSDSFDVVLSTQVLEHVPRPWLAMAEIARVLVPGGTAILTVPHLSMIHEAPTDFFRFTPFALERLARDAGLEVVTLEPVGGLVAFLAHPASLALWMTVGRLPGLRTLTRIVNEALLVRPLRWIDRVLGMPGRYPCNLLLVARKTTASARSA